MDVYPIMIIFENLMIDWNFLLEKETDLSYLS